MDDPYVWENGVLINKLNITNYDDLKIAEKDITFSKFLNIDNKFKHNFSSNDLKNIHHYIFEDVFDWSGEYRVIPMYKAEDMLDGFSLKYSDPENIEDDVKNCLDKLNSINWTNLSLEQKSKMFTDLLLQLWTIHPFRDGNTRTTLTFAYHFSKEHDFPLDLPMLLQKLNRTPDENGVNHSIRDKFVLSTYLSGSKLQLTDIFNQSIISGVNKQINNLKRNIDSDLEI